MGSEAWEREKRRRYLLKRRPSLGDTLNLKSFTLNLKHEAHDLIHYKGLKFNTRIQNPESEHHQPQRNFIRH